MMAFCVFAQVKGMMQQVQYNPRQILPIFAATQKFNIHSRSSCDVSSSYNKKEELKELILERRIVKAKGIAIRKPSNNNSIPSAFDFIIAMMATAFSLFSFF